MYIYLRLTGVDGNTTDGDSLLNKAISRYARLNEFNVGEIFNHIEINYKLDNKFYAVSGNTKDASALHISEINSNSRYSQYRTFSLYRIPVNLAEWRDIKSIIDKMYDNRYEIKYDYKAYLKMGIDTARGARSRWKDTTEPGIYTCASFIACILMCSLDDFMDYIRLNKFNIRYMHPMDLLGYPRVQCLIKSDVQSNWSKDLTELVKGMGK